jgi:hypothetical protein
MRSGRLCFGTMTCRVKQQQLKETTVCSSKAAVLAVEPLLQCCGSAAIDCVVLFLGAVDWLILCAAAGVHEHSCSCSYHAIRLQH